MLKPYICYGNMAIHSLKEYLAGFHPALYQYNGETVFTFPPCCRQPLPAAGLLFDLQVVLLQVVYFVYAFCVHIESAGNMEEM